MSKSQVEAEVQKSHGLALKGWEPDQWGNSSWQLSKPVAFCSAKFNGQFHFDRSGRLFLVGLSSASASMDRKAPDCVLREFTRLYGSAILITKKDGIRVDTFAQGALRIGVNHVSTPDLTDVWIQYYKSKE